MFWAKTRKPTPSCEACTCMPRRSGPRWASPPPTARFAWGSQFVASEGQVVILPEQRRRRDPPPRNCHGPSFRQPLVEPLGDLLLVLSPPVRINEDLLR